MNKHLTFCISTRYLCKKEGLEVYFVLMYIIILTYSIDNK